MSLFWKTVTYECDMYRSTWEQHRITGELRNLKNTHTEKAIREANRIANMTGGQVGYQVNSVRQFATAADLLTAVLNGTYPPQDHQP